MVMMNSEAESEMSSSSLDISPDSTVVGYLSSGNACQRCPVCQEQLWSAKSQWIHRWLHADKFYYECPNCKEKFDEFEKLKLHQQKYFLNKSTKIKGVDTVDSMDSCGSCNGQNLESSLVDVAPKENQQSDQSRPVPLIHIDNDFATERIETDEINNISREKNESDASSDECLIIDECLVESSKPKNEFNGSLETTPAEPCYKCDMLFTDPPSLQEHLRQVHNEKMFYPCVRCGETFTRHSSLLNHIAMIHNRTALDSRYSKTLSSSREQLRDQEKISNRIRAITVAETKRLSKLQDSASPLDANRFTRFVLPSPKLPTYSTRHASPWDRPTLKSNGPRNIHSSQKNYHADLFQNHGRDWNGHSFPERNINLRVNSSDHHDRRNGEIAHSTIKTFPDKESKDLKQDRWLDGDNNAKISWKRLGTGNNPCSKRKSNGTNILKFHLNVQNQRKYESCGPQGAMDWQQTGKPENRSFPRVITNDRSSLPPTSNVAFMPNKSTKFPLPNANPAYSPTHSNVSNYPTQVNFYVSPTKSNNSRKPEQGRDDHHFNYSTYAQGPPLHPSESLQWNSSSSFCPSGNGRGSTCNEVFRDVILDTCSCFSCQTTSHLHIRDATAPVPHHQPKLPPPDYWSRNVMNWQSTSDACGCTQRQPRDKEIEVQIREHPMRQAPLSRENNWPYFIQNYFAGNNNNVFPQVKTLCRNNYYAGNSTSYENTRQSTPSQQDAKLLHNTLTMPLPLQKGSGLDENTLVPKSDGASLNHSRKGPIPRVRVPVTENVKTEKIQDKVPLMESLPPMNSSAWEVLQKRSNLLQSLGLDGFKMKTAEILPKWESPRGSSRIPTPKIGSRDIKEEYNGKDMHPDHKKKSVAQNISHEFDNLKRKTNCEQLGNGEKFANYAVEREKSKIYETTSDISNDTMNALTCPLPDSNGSAKKEDSIRCLICCALFMSEVDAKLHDVCTPEENDAVKSESCPEMK